MTVAPISKSEIEARLKTEYENWFKQLQALTDLQLDADDWVGRWYDGYAPTDALEAGPEGEDED